MAIEFRCAVCSKLLRTPDESAGKQAKCPQCGTIADVPAAGNSALGPSPATPGPAAPGPSTPGQPAIGEPGPMQPANPYQVTAAVEQPAFGAQAGGELRHQQFVFDDMLSTPWQIFSANIGPMLIVGLIVFGVSFAISMVGQIGGMAAQATGEMGVIVGVAVLQNLFNVLAQIWIQLGLVKYVLQLIRRGQVEVGDFFSVGPYYLRGFLVYLIIMLIMVAVFAVCAIPAGAVFAAQGPQGVQNDPAALIAAASIGLLVMMVVQFLIFIRFFFVYQFIVDRDASALEAISLSASYMYGNKLTGFLGMLVIGLIGSIFVLCTCGFGQIAFMPFYITSVSVAYLIATGQMQSGATTVSPVSAPGGGDKPFG